MTVEDGRDRVQSGADGEVDLRDQRTDNMQGGIFSLVQRWIFNRQLTDRQTIYRQTDNKHTDGFSTDNNQGTDNMQGGILPLLQRWILFFLILGLR